MIKGVDIARYQPHVNYAALARAVDFCAIKVSDGLGTDPLLKQHWAGARANKIRRAGYHFLRPGDGRAQAQHYLQMLKAVSGSDRFLTPEEIAAGLDGMFGVGLDVEWSPRKNPHADDTWREVSVDERLHTITAFITEIEAATGEKAIIYTARSWWDSMLGHAVACGNVRFSDHHLWLADYDGNPLPLPGAWQTYSIWQTSGHGHIEGIREEVDLDVLRPGLSLADLRKRPASPGALFPAASSITRVLRRGATGPDVLMLQQALIRQGFLPEADFGSRFEEKTEQAVRALQKKYNLVTDGVVGPKTRAVL